MYEREQMTRAATTKTPYQDTSVPVARSQSALRDLLKAAGATRVEFGEDFERGAIEIRFGWKIKPGADYPAHEEGQPVTVRLQVIPLPPERGRYATSPDSITADQRERQAWRGLYWYLKAMLDAANFGLLAFEDVFLSFIEAEPRGATVGEVVINQLALRGRLELTAGEPVEGEVVG